jgi:alkyl sulfatase BDS1-like metallo-beta-lactamase superfamily hydrolase
MNGVESRSFFQELKPLHVLGDMTGVRLDLEILHLNNNYGLYEVIPGIYQVRGFDLADITFVRGKTGWIVFDVLASAEPVRAAWKLFQEHVGKGLPVSAIIYSHSHADHWGGVRGLVKEEEVRSGKVPIIAPPNFMMHTIAENVYAGNAMNRRLFYQYGLLLPASPHGYVGQGLGQAVSAGAVGPIAPTRIVENDIEELEVDGIKMVFQNTPSTEAPTEMNTYIPGMKALWMAENVIASVHNIYNCCTGRRRLLLPSLACLTKPPLSTFAKLSLNEPKKALGETEGKFRRTKVDLSTMNLRNQVT